jgi:hypothetical protein
MPLVESTRGTLDETISNPEEKEKSEPEAPTVTQEPIGGSLGERPTHSQDSDKEEQEAKEFDGPVGNTCGDDSTHAQEPQTKRLLLQKEKSLPQLG